MVRRQTRLYPARQGLIDFYFLFLFAFQDIRPTVDITNGCKMEVDDQDDRPSSDTHQNASFSANSDSFCLLATSESLSSKTPPPTTNNQAFLPPCPPPLPPNSGNTPFPYSTPPSTQNHPGNSNDSSNLSNGGSGSDKEAESANKQSSSQSFAPLSTPNTPETTKQPRKRKTTATGTPKTPKRMSKMIDLYGKVFIQCSGFEILISKFKEAAMSINLAQNGDNSVNDVCFILLRTESLLAF